MSDVSGSYRTCAQDSSFAGSSASHNTTVLLCRFGDEIIALQMYAQIAGTCFLPGAFTRSVLLARQYNANNDNDGGGLKTRSIDLDEVDEDDAEDKENRRLFD